MIRVSTFVLAFILCITYAQAQVYFQPSGTFNRKNFRENDPVPFQAKLSDPDLEALDYTFQLFVNEGTTSRVLQSQTGTNWWMWVDMLHLPASPEPQLSVVVRVRHKYSGTSYTLSSVMPIRIVETDIKIVEIRGWEYTDKLTPLIVGQQQGKIYSIFNTQPNTRKVSLVALGPTGDTVSRSELVGNPYVKVAVLDTVYAMVWPGARRLRGMVYYDNGPADGYIVEAIIPDSIPRPIVEATAGFGPFKASVDQLNTFIVKGLGPICTSIDWAVQYETDNGLVRTPISFRRAYDTTKDSMHVVLNMRDLSPRSTLVVTANYGPYLPSTQMLYPIAVERANPTYRIGGVLPIKPGGTGLDTVTIDSLPPRILNLKMILTSGSGATVREVNIMREAPAYIRSGSLTFNQKDLALGTYVVRTRALNEFKDDGPDYFYGFDVRDTSTFFLIADSWGPFTRGDSATITPAVTDIRPVAGPKPDKILGRFTLIDSLDPTRPLYTSVLVDLSGVRSRDSVVHCPDSSYLPGDERYRRARLQTIDLPLSSHVRFERLIVRGSDTTRDQQLEHPVFVVPAPGKLSASPRLDTVYTVTRNQPLTLTVSDLVEEATAVRFTVLGMKDPEPVAETVVNRVSGQNAASWTVDAGLLPVNAQVVVTAITPLANNVGSTITRLINTAPDTLSMQAIPPIDTLLMDWALDPATQLITGVDQFTPKLTFTKIPAQTRSIELLSLDDSGQIIDSIAVPVPYRTKYDATLSVETPFTFRTFNTTTLQVRYISDGGPKGGIRYNHGIVTRYYRPGMATVKKMNLTAIPPVVDPSPILQGSDDVVALSLRWSRYNTTSPSGYNSTLAIDSVRLEIKDCAGNMLDYRLIRPTPAMERTGIAADTFYSVRRLPLSTASITYRLYSKSMTLPRTGMVYSEPFTLRTNPRIDVPLGTTYPSYRVTDTTNGTLIQRMTITNLDGVVSLDSLSFIGKNGKRIVTFDNTKPVHDTIRLPEYDFNQLNPNQAPYYLIGTVRTATCSQQSSTVDTLTVISVPRISADPAATNWVFSSKGWGPFQQGRAPQTQVLVNLNPSTFITKRAAMSDSLEVSVVGWSSSMKIFTPDVPTTFSYPAAAPLPTTLRYRGQINLTPFDTTSSIAIHVRWLQRGLTGVTVVADSLMKYPVRMLPFPDQPIEADTADLEQSVLAGSSAKVMQSMYDFAMKPQSASIDMLTFRMLSTTEYRLDTFAIKPASRNRADSTSEFTMQRDVAQYPWPHIARERDRVTIEIGYQFEGATKPTKIQKTACTILPRADWLNGTEATLAGNPTDTVIPITATIPMPSSWYENNVPMYDTVRYEIISAEPGKTTNIVVRADYNPVSRQFTMRGAAPSGSLWNPSVSIFGGGNINYSNVASDKAKSGEFEALYRFERAPLADNSDTVDNRELRLRSLYSSNYRGVVSVVRWVKNFMEVIREFAKVGSAAATGGLIWVEPFFVLDGSVRHLSVNNIGTSQEGSLLHLDAEEAPTKNTEQNEFPTSQAMAFTITGGGGVDVSLLGLFGIGAAVTQDYMFGSGTTFANSVSERTSQYYPTALDLSQWFNIEMSLFFGIIKVELFRGRYIHEYDPRLMPSFLVFDESIGSIFKGGVARKSNEATQMVTPIAKLPVETPYYRPAPKVAGNDDVLLSVHLEQSLLGSNGRIVLSSLDRSTHSLIGAKVIAENRNGIHDPRLTLCGKGGSAFVGWAQNDVQATSTYASNEALDLLRYENSYLAFYDAGTQHVQHLPPPADQFLNLLDGVPSIAVSQDSVHAMVAWPAMGDDGSYSDVYYRPIQRDSGAWKYGEAKRILRLPGVDRDVNIVAMNDGSFILTWLNDVVGGESVALMSAIVQPDGSTDVKIINTVTGRAASSDLKMVGNGKDAVLMLCYSSSTDTTEYDRTLLLSRYQNGSWTDGEEIDPGMGRGLLRHLEGDVAADGSFFAMLDAVDYTATSGSEHNVVACVGSIYDSPSNWQVFRNTTSFTSRDRDIWSLSAAIGPENTLYIATQELDSVRDNRQTFGVGLPLGPARCNAAVRAFRINEKGDIVARPFGNTPTSVNESEADRLERTLRYRVHLLDPAPNPVREACVVPLAVQRPTNITMRLVDELGQYVSTLYNGRMDEGIQGVSFETSGLQSGHYTVVVTDDVGVVGGVPVVVIK